VIAIQQARVQVRLEYNQKLMSHNQVARNKVAEASTPEQLRTAHCNKNVQPTSKEQANCHENFSRDQEKLARDQDIEDPKRLKQCYHEPGYLCTPVLAKEDQSLRNKREKYLKDDYSILLFYATSFIVVCDIACEIFSWLTLVARRAGRD
jgi:hypothetical protein